MSWLLLLACLMQYVFAGFLVTSNLSVQDSPHTLNERAIDFLDEVDIILARLFSLMINLSWLQPFIKLTSQDSQIRK